MNTQAIINALNALRLKLYADRFFYLKYQQVTASLKSQFPGCEVYFDNNGTYKVQLSVEAAEQLKEEPAELVVPNIYDKVNDALIVLFNTYKNDLLVACNEIGAPWLFDHIMSGQCAYLGILYQARLIHSVILINI